MDNSEHTELIDRFNNDVRFVKSVLDAVDRICQGNTDNEIDPVTISALTGEAIGRMDKLKTIMESLLSSRE